MKTLLTHNGTFHADDVFAVATFLLAHPDEKWQVVRSREKELIEKADAVVDVGGVYDIARLRFDHHQEGGAGIRENTVPYASFGLVWNIFGEMICGDKFVKEEVERRLVLSVDAHDNGMTLCDNNLPDIYVYELSNLVQDFNITWKEESDAEDGGESLRYDAFMDLVQIATKLIERIIKRAKDKNLAKDFVIKAYNEAEDKRLVILDRFYPWRDIILNFPEPFFVIFPSPVQGTWTLKTVPKEKNSFESRKLLPESWAGKRDGELAEISGVFDAIFCHNARFLAIAKSKEGALHLAQIALES